MMKTCWRRLEDRLIDLNRSDFRITFCFDQAPDAWTKMKKGRVFLTKNALHISAKESISLEFSADHTLDYVRQYNQFYVTIDTQPKVFMTPVMWSFFGHLQIMFEPDLIAFYTKLHRLFGGPGFCRGCGYDLRMSQHSCPDCGSTLVVPRRQER